ncbi:hypothetical protein C8R48DRAFT_728371 [Suillus tomentosus]|nr:hypothetical protein C8R48DRAFT_728371 [Suillus tomentosus]
MFLVAHNIVHRILLFLLTCSGNPSLVFPLCCPSFQQFINIVSTMKYTEIHISPHYAPSEWYDSAIKVQEQQASQDAHVPFRLGVLLSLMTLLTSLACTDSPANILKSAIVLSALYHHTSIVPNIQMPWKYKRDKTWSTHLFS